MADYELDQTARQLVAPGKGILAADESGGTIAKRFAAIGVDSTEPQRRAYRQLLFTARGIEEAISGVIMYDETLRQETDDGLPFPHLLAQRGILPGIKVDKGAKPMASFPGEKVTEGLDGLRERLKEYRELGARFAKWRAVITIGHGIPTRTCIVDNARALARYASLTQEANLVPIVEPEVLMDGDHPLERCEEVTAATLESVYRELRAHRVMLEGTLLKPNLVLPGTECEEQVGDAEIAVATIRCLRRTVPPAVPGIVFLSGGMTSQEATRRLNEMNRLGGHPWQLSFSFGRALQQEALAAWGGLAHNEAKAQAALAHRALLNAAARKGRYRPEMEEGREAAA